MRRVPTAKATTEKGHFTAALEATEEAGVDVRLADRVLVRGRARLARRWVKDWALNL